LKAATLMSAAAPCCSHYFCI